MGLKMNEKKSVTSEMAMQYRQANKSEKGVILNAFTGITGYHRKYAIKVLKRASKTCLTQVYGKVVVRKAERKKRAKREYPKYYDDDVQTMLLRIWREFDTQCGKLLAPFMRANIEREQLLTNCSKSAMGLNQS